MLQEFHRRLNAVDGTVNETAVIRHYGDPLAELKTLRSHAILIDESSRGRLCILGKDRQRFLNGQVTNDVAKLQPGQGCYACLLSAKAKIQSDLNIHALNEELLLDMEPGMATTVAKRLQAFVIADDVEVVDVASHYGLISVYGPESRKAVEQAGLHIDVTPDPWTHAHTDHPQFGDVYAMNRNAGPVPGFRLFIPVDHIETVANALLDSVRGTGGSPAGWEAMELHRIESGIPRFGQDMDESNMPPEAGLEDAAISYSKGCYIGQEIIARIRTYGQVTRRLCGLELEAGGGPLPSRGEPLFFGGKETGCITSAIDSPTLNRRIALGYVRKENNALGTELAWRSGGAELKATIVETPFV